MYIGSPRFQCQELSEISFRSYMREYAPDFELLESIATLESEDYGEERTHDLLQRHPDLCGFYMGGSGIEGVLRALRAHKPAHRIVGVGNEITSVTRSGLLSGHFHVLLAHPLPLLCQDLIDAMADSLAQPGRRLSARARANGNPRAAKRLTLHVEHRSGVARSTTLQR